MTKHDVLKGTVGAALSALTFATKASKTTHSDTFTSTVSHAAAVSPLPLLIVGASLITVGLFYRLNK